MNLHFAWPWAALLLPLPLLVGRWLRPFSTGDTALLASVPALFASAVAADEGPGRALRPAWVTAALWLAWLGLIAALCRPQFTGEPLPLPGTGRDLLLAVDISGSMNTPDMVSGERMITRLDAVKRIVQAFVKRRTGDRVGLIVFGSNAYLYAPLTFDRETVAQMLLDLHVNMAGGHTAIGDAIGLGVKHLRDRPAHDRVLMLLTDGVSNAGELTPEQAARIAAQQHIRVHAIGLGGDTLRLPAFFGLDPRIVNPSSDLDEVALSQVATLTAGRYFRARNPRQLEQIYTALDSIEPVAQETSALRPRAALHHWPLAFALAISALLGVRHAQRARHG